MLLELKYKLNSPDAPSFVVVPETDPVRAYTMGYESAQADYLVQVYAVDPGNPESFTLVYQTPIPEPSPASARRAKGEAAD